MGQSKKEMKQANKQTKTYGNIRVYIYFYAEGTYDVIVYSGQTTDDDQIYRTKSLYTPQVQRWWYKNSCDFTEDPLNDQSCPKLPKEEKTNSEQSDPEVV